MKKFEYCIFIGNFQPFLSLHEKVLREALDTADKVVVVLGSHKTARNIKTPWTTEERINMINGAFPNDLDKIVYVPLRDQLYSDTLWSVELQQKVSEIIGNSDSVAIIGNERDSSYLKSFPQWHLISVKESAFSSKEIRNRYFTYDTSYQRFVPPNVAIQLAAFQETESFKNLKSDFDYVRSYTESWVGAPFKPIFVTVDAIVCKSAHILLVRRRGNPGKGLFALPGGFLNQEEEIEDAALRELKEETSIKLPKDELRKHIVASQVYSAPFRSLRGRTITHAYLINLGDGPLDKVKGTDDADKAFWLPLNEIDNREDQFFEDHFYIIKNLINKI